MHLSCGACTYLCPTCYCFNITDDKGVSAGERVRSWDACMFRHFTLEASGHNPRTKKAQRFKNSVGHKFVYYPDKYDGEIRAPVAAAVSVTARYPWRSARSSVCQQDRGLRKADAEAAST